MTPADAGEGCSGDGGPVPAVMIEPAPLPNVRGFEAPSLRATSRFRNKAFAPLSTQSKVLRPIISMKEMKVSASRMKPAMKAMTSMKPMTYVPGTLVPLQESGDAPGSRPTIYPPPGCRSSKNMTPNDELTNFLLRTLLDLKSAELETRERKRARDRD